MGSLSQPPRRCALLRRRSWTSLAGASLAVASSVAAAGPLDIAGPLQQHGEGTIKAVGWLGPKGSGKTTLLQAMFGSEAEPQTVLEDPAVALVEADSSTTYSPERRGFNIGSRDGTTALALCDVVVYNTYLHDLTRDASAITSDLQPALEGLLALCAEQVLEMPQKKTLVVAVHDFDQSEAEKSQVVQSVNSRLSSAWDAVVKPDALKSASLSELFEVTFAFLPHRRYASEDYATQAQQLRSSVLSSSADTSAEALLNKLGRVSSHAHAGFQSASVKELQAAYEANAAFAKALATFKRALPGLDGAAEGLDEEFGDHCDSLIDRIVDLYEEEAGAAARSRVGQDKAGQLRGTMVRLLTPRYQNQLRLLRAATLNKFRTALAALRMPATIVKDSEAALEEADKYYGEAVKGLRSRHASWAHEYERKQLKDEMREYASDRLQLAKLQGAYIPETKRKPVGLMLNWLLPKPFGNDAKQSIMDPDDPLAFVGTKPKAESLFFEFDPLDDIEAPTGTAEIEPAQLKALKDRAERMIYRQGKQ